MSRFCFLTLGLLLLTVTACGDRLTETDPAVPLQVAAGKEFDIIIRANITTGYEWRLVGALDETVAQFVARRYEPDKPITTGSGGLDVWTFQAVAPGESQIVLGYYPPDGSDMPDQTATYTIIVE
ncbi:MAG TPA: protease inhibitor I42 family protein [Chloroflexota bacterium]|nr:protease inhibitor I42 family protein [Chloroflexota bacterium]HUM70179.1 protease inhibitor I42 family protein [Chloroflexota bacterium]